MPEVEWRVTQNASAVFRQLRDQMDNPQPAFKEMLHEAGEHQAAWFRTEGRSRWDDLSPRYYKWKKKRFPGRKIMHGPTLKPTEPKQRKDGTWTAGRSTKHVGGALRDDLTRKSRTNPGGKFGVEEITDKGWYFGTNIEYAEAHNKGLGKMPRRRLIAPMGGSMMKKFEGILLDHLTPAPTASRGTGQRMQPRRKASRAQRRGR